MIARFCVVETTDPQLIPWLFFSPRGYFQPMSQTTPTLSRSAQPGEPVWEIAELFPEQGAWSEEDYLALTTNRLVEFDNGMIEVLPLPTLSHQLIAAFIYDLLKAFLVK